MMRSVGRGPALKKGWLQACAASIELRPYGAGYYSSRYCGPEQCQGCFGITEHVILFSKHPSQCVAQVVDGPLPSQIFDLAAIPPQQLDLVLADESRIDGDIEIMP